MTFAELYRTLASSIGEHEGRIVLEESSGLGFAEALTRFDGPVPDRSAQRALDMARRRGAGEPLQHIVGHWPFRTLEVLVDARALVPRPQTEEVVSVALRELDRQVGDGATGPLVADLGTGSGVIALSLASERPAIRVLAVDSSAEALELAAANRARVAPSVAARVELLRGNWYEALPVEVSGRIDCVVANPPYLSPEEWEACEPVVRDHDPRAALVGGADGTAALAAVVAGAPGVLRAGGALVMEIGSGQGATARALARGAGARRVAVERDLGGRDRVLVASF